MNSKEGQVLIWGHCSYKHSENSGTREIGEHDYSVTTPPPRSVNKILPASSESLSASSLPSIPALPFVPKPKQ